MEWFENDEQLLEKYWSMVRPEEGMETKVYGLDADVMNYIDQIVDRYLLNTQEGNLNGEEDRKANQ